jgi:hypothetical protein
MLLRACAMNITPNKSGKSVYRWFFCRIHSEMRNTAMIIENTEVERFAKDARSIVSCIQCLPFFDLTHCPVLQNKSTNNFCARVKASTWLVLVEF